MVQSKALRRLYREDISHAQASLQGGCVEVTWDPFKGAIRLNIQGFLPWLM